MNLGEWNAACSFTVLQQIGIILSTELAMHLHQFQQQATDRAVDSDEQYHLLASPTGTGKTFMGWNLLDRLEQPYFITPRVEIVADMLKKRGLAFSTQAELLRLADQHRIGTPIRIRNRMIQGWESDIKNVILDECHHESADTYQQIHAMLPDDTRYFGLTATPYRGTPKQTKAFLERWGEPNWAITYPQAVAERYLALPECETWGLVDDDIIELSSTGEFVQSTLCAEVSNNLEHALIRACESGLFLASGKPARPTIIGVPSSAVFPQLKLEADLLGLAVAFIDQSTSYAERQRLFTGVKNSQFALVHINVVSEGVDLPIRQYLDLCPVMSPVAFMQRFGRATRPTDEIPRYICTNHNLERHGYLLDGLLPPRVFIEAQKAFNKPSERSGKARASGVQSLGKIKATTVKLLNGLQCSVYAISAMDGHKKQSYLALLHPSYASPLWFKRADTHGDTVAYGKWSIESNPPADLQGFKSLPSNALSEKQVNWWNKAAKNVGLDPTQELSPKVFQLLPALNDVNASL